MRKLFGPALLLPLLLGCGNKEDVNKFTLTGDVKSLPDQQVYLEEIYFGGKNAEVLDTAEVKNGKFVLSATALQEGLFRVSFEKTKALFLVISDKKELSFTADANNLSLKTISINSPANASFNNFINETNKKGEELQNLAAQLKNAEKKPDTTVIANDPGKEYTEKESAFANYIYAYADTCGSPTLALFALGYVSNPPSDRLQKAVTALSKRFPKQEAVSSVLSMVNLERERANRPPPPPMPQPGSEAPDITMPDTDGNMFALSSLRGKYVLVDFWASWCGPCRKEAPGIVKVFNKYSSKNFTVLGVSLDENKQSWLNAINELGLPWKHISDLKKWESEAQRLYQFGGIPYNVLIDPQGKIVFTDLHGNELEEKLEEILK